MTPAASAGFILYLLATFYFFAKMPVRRAVSHAIILGWLFLPEKAAFNWPMMPPLDKDNIPPTLCLFLNFFLGRKLFKESRLTGMVNFLVVGLVLSNIPRIYLNQDSVYGGGGIAHEGIPLRSILNFALSDLWLVVGTFRLGMALASKREHLIEFLQIWLRYAVIYALLSLYEVRFSPMLHTRLYGYFQHSFEQMIRDGGFRPIVFMEHALAVGIYLYVSTSIAFLLRAEPIKIGRFKPKAVAWLSGIALIFSKCTASTAYFVGTMGASTLKNRRMQMLVSVMLASLVISMPVLRYNKVIDIDRVLQWSEERFGQDRTESLKFRFVMEEALVKRVTPRAWFGYGGSGRYNTFTESGRSEIVVDSAWIIVWSERGFVGYVFFFGLLTWPLFFIGSAVKRAKEDKDKRLLAGLAMICGMSLLDLMINGLFNPTVILFVGLLWGASRAQWLSLGEQQATGWVPYPYGYYPGHMMPSQMPMPGAVPPGQGPSPILPAPRA